MNITHPAAHAHRTKLLTLSGLTTIIIALLATLFAAAPAQARRITPETPLYTSCPTRVNQKWVRRLPASQAPNLCRDAVNAAATYEASSAIRYAFAKLGAPYACNGIGRTAPNRYDCSTFVARAYREGAGLPRINANEVTWTMQHRSYLKRIRPARILPGDLIFIRLKGTNGYGPTGHVMMYLGRGYVIDTGDCGDGVRIKRNAYRPNVHELDGVYRVIPDRAR